MDATCPPRTAWVDRAGVRFRETDHILPSFTHPGPGRLAAGAALIPLLDASLGAAPLFYQRHGFSGSRIL